MQFNLVELTELGFPYFAFILMAIGLAKGLWPWWKDEYWASREKRWHDQNEASKVREQRMMDQASAFLKAIEAYQDGFAAANAEQHQAGIELMQSLQGEIRDYHNTNISVIELLVTRLDGGDD